MSKIGLFPCLTVLAIVLFVALLFTPADSPTVQAASCSGYAAARAGESCSGEPFATPVRNRLGEIRERKPVRSVLLGGPRSSAACSAGAARSSCGGE